MTNSAKNSPNKPGLKLKLEDEMKKALSLTLYFGIWFCAITFMATTALEERPIPLTLFGFALIKAGLSAKFMLIAQAAYPIKVDKAHGIVGPLFIESIVYIIVIIALNYIEASVTDDYNLIQGNIIQGAVTLAVRIQGANSLVDTNLI